MFGFASLVSSVPKHHHQHPSLSFPLPVSTLFAMLFSTLALAGLAAANKACNPPSTYWETKYTATGVADVAAAAATAKTSSPTSHVPGKAFDRLVIVYFENQDYDKSIGDRKLSS